MFREHGDNLQSGFTADMAVGPGRPGPARPGPALSGRAGPGFGNFEKGRAGPNVSGAGPWGLGLVFGPGRGA
ncbi:unnamed protein product [Bursaphelenchus xylophilus]|uniref:(pine wood nematode) hypothetical protein n=1 Tax=Bursaphelenchus xylophilus TaxID=6326 RepID=A0A7I8X959_BURXY|nr:unnamed protein product [Bursaphelenchus xylophilus]CAG9118695.1 unnamed protein product [Bursaphelenchus xylophilus]